MKAELTGGSLLLHLSFFPPANFIKGICIPGYVALLSPPSCFPFFLKFFMRIDFFDITRASRFSRGNVWKLSYYLYFSLEERKRKVFDTFFPLLNFSSTLSDQSNDYPLRQHCCARSRFRSLGTTPCRLVSSFSLGLFLSFSLHLRKTRLDWKRNSRCSFGSTKGR